MLALRKASTRGFLEARWYGNKFLDEPWIRSRRTFSNNSYLDPRYMNFGHLQVINDDVLMPGYGVPSHRHADMEILGYVVDGPCTHWDDLGNAGDAGSDDVQFMSCGSGISHTESNGSDRQIRYLQIWFSPSANGTPPRYSKLTFPREERANRFVTIASPDGPHAIGQDASVMSGIFDAGHSEELRPSHGHYAYAVKGIGSVNGIDVSEGDGIAITGETALDVVGSGLELLLLRVGII